MSVFVASYPIIRHPFLEARENARGDMERVFGDDENLFAYCAYFESGVADSGRRPDSAEDTLTLYVPSSQVWDANDEVTVDGYRFRLLGNPDRYEGVRIDGQVLKARWTRG